MSIKSFQTDGKRQCNYFTTDISTSSLHSNSFLDSINCQIHMVFKAIICMFCGAAFAPHAILGHCKNEHPNIKRDPDSETKLAEIVEEYGIVSTVPLPTFYGPPVEGLKEHQDGLICAAENCNYACRKESSMDQHWTKCHKDITMLKQKCSQHGVVQTFFTVTGTNYFAVNQSLVDAVPDGLYSTFIRDYTMSA
jgi:hypothetical protein